MNKETPTPLQHLFSRPTTPEEGVARATMILGRMVGFGWQNQKLIENYLAMAQTATFSLWEDLWSNCLEACYLKDPKRAEKIEVS